jgi:hypothetical protein
MSRDKGNRAPHWVARYLTRWWPLAEAVPNGRGGADILNTPGVTIEVKTGVTWREKWLEQARKHGGAITPLIYLGPGIGEANVSRGQMVFTVAEGMRLLQEAGYCVRVDGHADGGMIA